MRSKALRGWPIAALVVAALGVAGVVYGAPTSILDGATASQPAKRLTPPGPRIGGCRVFPADNAWNQEISSLPLHPQSSAIIGRVGASKLHPDFGENPTAFRTWSFPRLNRQSPSRTPRTEARAIRGPSRFR